MPGRVSRITVSERTIIWCSSTCRKTDAPRESVNRKFKPLDACSLHAAPPAETRQPEPERKGAAELYRGSCSAPRFGCARDYRTAQGTPLGRSRKPGTARERGKAGRSPTTSPPCRADAFVGPEVLQPRAGFVHKWEPSAGSRHRAAQPRQRFVLGRAVILRG